MITLHDTFNGHLISRHRTMVAAIRAESKFLDGVEKANGAGSYVTTAIRIDGMPLTDDQRNELEAARLKLKLHGW